MLSSFALMDALYHLQQMSFSDLLNSFLEEKQASMSDLHHYLLDQDYEIEKTSIYRYFSSTPKVTRKPDKRFVDLFADFVCLSTEQKTAIVLAWKIKSKRHLR